MSGHNMTDVASGRGEDAAIDETRTASGTVIPFKQAFLISMAAGLGYGFDSYAVNIFGMLAPVIS